MHTCYIIFLLLIRLNGIILESLKGGKLVGSILGKINDLNIGICYFSTKQTTLQVKNND